MAGGGGAEPNLTPFIDLFSVLICFLLMTAAWLNLETFPVQIEKAPSPDQQSEVAQPPPPDDKKKVSLSFTLMYDQVMAKEDERQTPIPHLPGGEIDQAVIEQILTEWRMKFPDKKDLVLNTEARVKYGQMISFYDLLIALDWPDVGINPN